MPVSVQLRSAVGSDMGRRRTNNEDRFLHEPDRGIFAVVDGVGGHAAGEQAAGTAVEVLRERLSRQTGTPEERLREAIALANNEIFHQAQARPDWHGMACVLTAAVVEDDLVTVGHVGDSRLYLIRPGEIRKMTHDHSPVGEREDKGELSEAAAMQHPRRNEIYRDVGTSEKSPDDPAFVEIVKFRLPSDGAFLLCTDGLSDLVFSRTILDSLERYAGDLDAAVQNLIDIANAAGGKDNVTVLAVAGPAFAGRSLPAPGLETQSPAKSHWVQKTVALGVMLAAGAGAMFLYLQWAAQGPRTIAVTGSIVAALAEAHSGDTLVVPPGTYREKVDMRPGVAIRTLKAGSVSLISPDGGPALVARGIDSGSIEGFWIQGGPEHPAVLIDGASPALHYLRITGGSTGVEVRGPAGPSITASRITNNVGPGIDVGADSHPIITGNLIAANGAGVPGSPRPGVEVRALGKPVLKDNGIVDNAAEPIWIHSRTYPPADFDENLFGGIGPKKAIRLLELPVPAPVAVPPARGARGGPRP